MPRHFRFIDYLANGGAAHATARLGDLYPEPERAADGRVVRIGPVTRQLTTGEGLRLLQPYVSVRFREQFRAVAPLAAYLVLFQVLILRHRMDDSWIIIGGLFAAIVGLMLFMEGLKLGLMPFGTLIGATLPRKSPLPVVLIITLLLGIGVTLPSQRSAPSRPLARTSPSCAPRTCMRC